MKEIIHKPSEMTDSEIKFTLESEEYKEWLTDLMMSGDWKEFCLECTHPKGRYPSEDLLLYVYVYLRYDNRGTQKAWEREFEFSLWLFERYSDAHQAFECAVLPFIEEYDIDTITRIVEMEFKNSNAYTPVMRLISRYRAVSTESGTDEGSKDNQGAKREKKIVIPDKLLRDIDKIQSKLIEKGICERKEDGVYFALSNNESGAANYSWLVYRLTEKYWGKSEVLLKWAEIDTLFKHDNFKTSSAKSKYSAWHNDSAEKPNRRFAIDSCVDK